MKQLGTDSNIYYRSLELLTWCLHGRVCRHLRYPRRTCRPLVRGPSNACPQGLMQSSQSHGHQNPQQDVAP